MDLRNTAILSLKQCLVCCYVILNDHVIGNCGIGYLLHSTQLNAKVCMFVFSAILQHYKQ